MSLICAGSVFFLVALAMITGGQSASVGGAVTMAVLIALGVAIVIWGVFEAISEGKKIIRKEEEAYEKYEKGVYTIQNRYPYPYHRCR